MTDAERTILEKAVHAAEVEFRSREMHTHSRWDSEDFTSVVRAVLTAIREPDQPMLIASYRGDTSRDHWQQMIDAILSEEVK